MSYPFSLYLRQMELEREMRGVGKKRLEDSITDARRDHRETETPYGQMLLKSVVDPLTVKITEYLDNAFDGMAGRHATSAVMLRSLDPDKVAYLTVKTILDYAHAMRMDTIVAGDVGHAIEAEARWEKYHEQKPALMDTIVRDFKKRRKSTAHLKRVLKIKMPQAGATWTPWTERDCVRLGLVLIQLFIDTRLGIIEREVDPGVRKKRAHHASYRIVLGVGVDKLIADRTALSALLTPAYLPTVVPPRPWTSPITGGYWTDMVDRRAVRLVKTQNMAYLEDLRHVQMPAVYVAVNTVQATAWQINAPVLAVLRDVFDAKERAVGTLPRGEDEKIPTKPLTEPPCKCRCEARKAWGLTAAGLAWREWRKMAHAIHERNHRNRSRRVQVAKTLWVAAMFEGGEAFYFPHQLDFRSRVYAMPVFLQPQGPDYVRGLLRFHEGMPITTPLAKDWLAVHGANSYGIDKVSYQERVAWVRKNEQNIYDVGLDPMGMLAWWSVAENPWQFLAFCFEWTAMMAAKDNCEFVSHLPISLDGTCNGLQHFSAMLRDPVGGAAVNLTPSEQPQDIYQQVADRVIEMLRKTVRECGGGDDLAEGVMAEQWLAFGVSRKLTKRPVMILPYGGTQYACRQYVEEYVLDQILDQGTANPFDDGLMTAVVYLSKLIWEAISETVVAAKTTMEWLRGAARLMGKQKNPVALTWQTPVGFPVRQAYVEMDQYALDFVLDGARIYRRLNVETAKLDKDQQVNGLSPNFVHSLDAAALMESVIAGRRRGITSFAMVHDSYGTHAAMTEALADTLRRAFVNLYEKHDVLAELRASLVEAMEDSTKLPQVPSKGLLNIQEVLNSRFFFA